ncbi:hypothetical protein TWF730_001802 [Orbilia blumenaviensis]|uniref:Uncharacterized protein n=1 Tax=Orbilia blumenaviensis TaxID=1796055 RepID=A0AAV9UC25_9PEZI
MNYEEEGEGERREVLEPKGEGSESLGASFESGTAYYDEFVWRRWDNEDAFGSKDSANEAQHGGGEARYAGEEQAESMDQVVSDGIVDVLDEDSIQKTGQEEGYGVPETPGQKPSSSGSSGKNSSEGSIDKWRRRPWKITKDLGRGGGRRARRGRGVGRGHDRISPSL